MRIIVQLVYNVEDQQMTNMLTAVQTNTLVSLLKGAKVTGERRADGKWYFKSRADGLCSVLYLTLTCRSLHIRGYISVPHYHSGPVTLTAAGKLVVENV